MIVRCPDEDIWEVGEGVIVIPINTIGAMGRGLALDCKERFPFIYRDYRKICKKGEWGVNRLRMYLISDRFAILLLPTKQEWWNDSQLDWIADNLSSLNELMERAPLELQSLHIPLVGGGNGNLKFKDIEDLIYKHLDGENYVTYFYYPE